MLILCSSVWNLYLLSITWGQKQKIRTHVTTCICENVAPPPPAPLWLSLLCCWWWLRCCRSWNSYCFTRSSSSSTLPRNLSSTLKQKHFMSFVTMVGNWPFSKGQPWSFKALHCLFNTFVSKWNRTMIIRWQSDLLHTL